MHKEFIDLTDLERKQLIINTTLAAIDIAENALQKKKLDVSGSLSIETGFSPAVFEEYLHKIIDI